MITTRFPLVITSILLMLSLTGCSNSKTKKPSSVSPSVNSQVSNLDLAFGHPLKTDYDTRVESLIINKKWQYQRQASDCKDTKWVQEFFKNRYYNANGSACLLKGAFDLEAESWHIKDKYLYIVNLAPNNVDDIIVRYSIKSLTNKKMVLISNGFKYTFVNVPKPVKKKYKIKKVSKKALEPKRKKVLEKKIQFKKSIKNMIKPS